MTHEKDRQPIDTDFVLVREVDAPRDLVWDCWTNPERLKDWWGPKGFARQACTVDLRVGGLFHYGNTTPQGQTVWGKFTYTLIDPPNRLEFDVSFSDENGGTTTHPFAPNWPREVHSILILEDAGSKTKLLMRSYPINATDIEKKTFEEGRDSMRQGFGGTLSQLDEYVASLQ